MGFLKFFKFPQHQPFCDSMICSPQIFLCDPFASHSLSISSFLPAHLEALFRLSPSLSWEALGSRKELCQGWAVGMAALKCLRRDEKHHSCLGDSGPPSSCLGLEQVTVLGNEALFQCQIHDALAFPEHRRCKAAPHGTAPLLSPRQGSAPWDPSSGWACLCCIHSSAVPSPGPGFTLIH